MSDWYSGAMGRPKCADIVARDGWLWRRHDPGPIIAERDALRTQVERLREALVEIDAMPFSTLNDSESLRHTIRTIQHRARAALGEKP
jgi:hypothetical protein